MDCGATIYVKNLSGAYAYRFIAQCQGRFLMISHALDGRNGFMLSDWRGVLRELIALAVPAKLTVQTYDVEGQRNGRYVMFSLTYPLSVAGLADLLGVEVQDVREQLVDLAVSIDQ